MWFPNMFDTNRPVSSQKKGRSLKFWIQVEEELYYPCSENKGADQLCSVTAKLLCAFVFANADCWYPNEVAQMTI